ncbi:MAG TPA: type II toxin-antitoxin system RelE/ParE family toxin [Cyclobacteriaceae bacterium]|nr:type II toxin-antitoxin system RelE/ParE family toxin [Cyclobacteriaceae bacterium]
MAFQVFFHPQAETEYIEAIKWYEERLPGLGMKFENAVEKQIKLIACKPHHYQKKKAAFREAKTEKFPYIIVFKVYEKVNTILIAAVFHTSRNPKKKYRK